MGWFYLHACKTKKQLVDVIITETNLIPQCVILDHCIRLESGYSVLWLLKSLRQQVYIECVLMQPYGGYWGYKSIEEAESPLFHSCPLSFLKQAPVLSAVWRDQVQYFHQAKKEQQERRKTLKQSIKLGDTLFFEDGVSIPQITVIQIDGGMLGVYEQKTYRIRPKTLDYVKGVVALVRC